MREALAGIWLPDLRAHISYIITLSVDVLGCLRLFFLAPSHGVAITLLFEIVMTFRFARVNQSRLPFR